MMQTKSVIEFYSLPKEIQEDLELVKHWAGNDSYCKIDILRDEDRDEWLERVPSNSTKANCRVSDYFKTLGAKEGENSVIVLRSW